jgi:DNA-binding MarR family transcriptional regulator
VVEDDTAWYDEVVMPAMVASARTTYGMAIRRGLLDAGFDDMPKRGIALVAGIANNGPAGQQDVAQHLTMSKQAASQLVDALVLRDYIERAPDAADRRRMILTLTARGQEAAKASAAAVAKVDAAVKRRHSADEIATVRRVLGTMHAIGERARERRRAEETS